MVPVDMLNIQRGLKSIVEMAGTMPYQRPVSHLNMTHLNREIALKGRLPDITGINFFVYRKRIGRTVSVPDNIYSRVFYRRKIKNRIIIAKEHAPAYGKS